MPLEQAHVSGKFNKQLMKRDEKAGLLSASSKRRHPWSVAVGPIVAELRRGD